MTSYLDGKETQIESDMIGIFPYHNDDRYLDERGRRER